MSDRFDSRLIRSLGSWGWSIQLPPIFVVVACAMTFLPALLSLAGVDAGSAVQSSYQWVPDPWDSVLSGTPERVVPRQVASSFVFTLTNWFAFCLAAMTVVLALLHFGTRESRAPLVIALSLFFAGLFDGYHAVVASGLVKSGLLAELMPLSLTIGRIAVACIMVLGLGLLLFPWHGPVRGRPRGSSVRRPALVAWASFLLVTAVYFGILALLPRHSPNLLGFRLGPIDKPLNFLPLLIFLGPGLFIFWRFFRRDPSISSHSLFLSLLPLCAMEGHLAFGSQRLFDSHFNLAQYLKIVAYVVPFSGICWQYIQSQRHSGLMHQLQLAQSRLLEKTRDLERANRQLAQQVEKRLEFETLLRDSERLKASILHTALDGILTFDSFGRIRDFNETAGTVLGLANAGADVTVRDLLPERYLRRYIPNVKQGLSIALDERFLSRLLHVRLKRQSGAEFPAEVSLSQIRAGRDSLYTAFVRDITERLRYRQDLLAAREEAIRASLAKSEFLANMSHEIRTPLNAIIGMTDLLAESRLEPDQDKYLRICRRAGKTLLNIVNDVLDLSKIEAGQLALEEIDYDIHSLVEGVAEMMSIRAQEKGLAFTSILGEGVPRVVKGDPNRVRQVLLNLAGNAIKFTKQGEVSLRVDAVDVSSGPGLAIAVRDTGIGIPSAEIEHIFEKFAQADSSITRMHGGTGLGLSISKRLVEAMRGSISVKSEPGKGSVFRVEIPIVAPPSQAAVSTSDIFINLQGYQTLIIDASEARRLALRDHLESWGARVVEATGTDDVTAHIQAASEGFCLAFIGARQPGPETDRIARLVRTKAQAVILVAGSEGGAIGPGALGPFASVIPQPVKRSDLIETISQVLGKRRPDRIQTPIDAPDAMEREPKPAASTVRVLLVEDSADNRALVQAYLKGTIVELVTAENGSVGLSKFQTEPFDLVFMDMQMPVMDGYSATLAFRDWERTRGRPRTAILALTAHALSEEIRKTLDAGCDGHLSKPVKKSQLLEAIRIFTPVDARKGVQGGDRRKHEVVYDDLGGSP